jgi:hypothetical protein
MSTLYACDALKANGVPCRHIIIDPCQTSAWNSIGLANIQRAGFGGTTELHEKGSEIILPQLFAEGLKIQAAIICRRNRSVCGQRYASHGRDWEPNT